MGKMLHNEARELLVESYEKTHNAEEIAKIFGVNKYTVYHCLKQSPVRFCASVSGIASAGLRSVDIACNFESCYNVSKHLWNKVMKKFTKTQIETLIYQGIRKGTWNLLTNGSVKILYKYGGQIITGKVVNNIFQIGDAWVWNGIGTP